MSLYPILWAVEHAPVADAGERAILSGLAMRGSFDGRDCFRSYEALGKVGRMNRKTAERKCHAMERRGLIRRQTGPKPPGWKALPADKKTVIWELMIPADFWSATQLDEINAGRAERGLPPITRENRPPLAPAPPKKTRADKGRAAPQRRPKSLPPKDDGQDDGQAPAGPGETAGQTPTTGRGDSESRRGGTLNPVVETSGGTTNPVAGGLQIPSRGDSQSPEPPVVPPSSSSSSSSVTETSTTTARAGEEEEEEATAHAEDKRQHKDGRELAEALALVDDATRRWVGPAATHRQPTPSERLRLAERIVRALSEGATPDAVRTTLTRDLGASQVASTCVQLVMYRTGRPVWWADVPPPRPACRPDDLPEYVKAARARRDGGSDGGEESAPAGPVAAIEAAREVLQRVRAQSRARQSAG